MKKLIKSILSLIVLVLIVIAGYVAYVIIQYHRLPDNQNLVVKNVANHEQILPNKSYKIMTFNIGYGAYPADYTFFMAGGKESRARSKADVLANLAESNSLIKAENPDFVTLQEVDYEGDRSFKVDQPAFFTEENAAYGSVFANNYDSAYLFYPVTKPIGKAKSGLLTLSKAEMTKSTRFSLPIEKNFNKFLDLDRAFSASEIPVENGKKLYIYNVHMSAFIKDEVIQVAQLTKLFDNMKLHADNGDYVICGGDYNHVLTGKAHPELTWMKVLPTEKMATNMRVVAPTNAPSVRSNGTVYGDTSTLGIIDGFLVTNNVKDVSIQTIQNYFKSSDHNPVVMQFELN
ncbi:endonuclease [Lactococcus hodotermopsidis]|uniref:Endonuclease n=1 Tax=Pseudolactococcus hodotermopsidis TaxID=2709157 RepID=A0A6A0BCW7_9LACT|nr:endonuclease/exonuclease/phosphatase family protein [Lactococcus hodotermopsidis]GFH41667.1 endonuclease [Lactococcus hodotermopsidis]